MQGDKGRESFMKEPIFEIKKKSTARGEELYRYFSIRLKESTIKELDKIVDESNYSRNELINVMLEWCVKHTNIIEDSE